MIRTDGRPTIAMRESDSLLSNRDPGDEHYDRPERRKTERRRDWFVPGTDSANGTAKEDA